MPPHVCAVSAETVGEQAPRRFVVDAALQNTDLKPGETLRSDLVPYGFEAYRDHAYLRIS